MVKLLLGGSPCTYWSIAQTANRETEPTGLGWELFENYLIAKEKFKPDFFLYENNQSASQDIKNMISSSLNEELMYINSSLVSAQNRQRFYVFNWKIEQPADRGIMLRDILDMDNKSDTLLTKVVDKPKRVATVGKGGQGNRIYSVDAKGVTLLANSGGIGSNTGLYAIPIGIADNNCVCNQFSTKSIPAEHITGEPIFNVVNGQMNIEGTGYCVGLPDGKYQIRKLTVAESCRMQTLPDNYCDCISAKQAYKGLGNGWTAEVIIHILKGALDGIDRNETIEVLSMYDGIGTGRYCLDKLGFKNIKYYSYEIDEHAKSVACHHYPDIIQCGDAFALRNDDWGLPNIDLGR